MSLLRETVYLGDFGMAIKAGDGVEHKVLWPIIYCAPERFHDANPSFSSAMCEVRVDSLSYLIYYLPVYIGWCVLLSFRFCQETKRFGYNMYIRHISIVRDANVWSRYRLLGDLRHNLDQ